MESDFHHWLRTRLPHDPRLLLGLGDDAAILRIGQQADSVVTVDLLADQVHFRGDRDDPRHIGYKALAVNLSDLAAMAARPLAAVIALNLPRSGAMELATELYEGLLPLAEQFNLVIAGGDTNCWDGPLVISVTLIGEVTEHGPLCRGGAKPGDQLLVTGAFGGSILGHHLQFTPRIREALLLNRHYTLHAGMDCSDGLSLDLSRLAEESGCGAALWLENIPIAPAAEQLALQSEDGSTPLDHALADGEDFELILAVPPGEAARLLADQPLGVPLTNIGEIVTGSGLWQDTESERRPLEARGYLHKDS
jgi:thiamine-monophosphate kinase